MTLRHVRDWAMPLVALAVAMLLPAGPAVAEPGDSCAAVSSGPQSVQLNVRYQGEPPVQVRIKSPSRREVCLRHDPDTSRFFGSYPTPSPPRLFVATVVAVFRDGQSISVPLDLGFRREPLTFTLPRPQPGPCLRNAVQRMRGDSGSRDAALALAYQARLWYQAGPGCPDSLKPDVARAWFDRSFKSVQREHSFRLDRAAAEALSSQPVGDARQRASNANYVRERLGQYARLDAIKRRDLQLALGEAGFTIDAIAMATAIETAIETDQTSAAVYREEGVTLDLLQTDRQFYVTAGRVSPLLAAHIAERTTANSATIQIMAAETIQSEGGPRQQ